MKDFLNGRDMAVMRFLNQCIDEGVGSPSTQEIAEAVGVSRARVSAILDFLELQGYVSWRIANRRRSPRGLMSVLDLQEVERLNGQAKNWYDARKLERERARARRRMRARRAQRKADVVLDL